MSYKPSNTVLHASILLANVSFAYTLPIIHRAFPFHIVTILAYTLTFAYHLFVLCTGNLQNRPFTVKIVTTDEEDRERETTWFSTHINMSPSSTLGTLLSVAIASLWMGSWISRIVFMAIKHSQATFMGLNFLMFEAFLTLYIAVVSLVGKLEENGVKVDLGGVAKKGVAGAYEFVEQSKKAIQLKKDSPTSSTKKDD